ncbi:unnamed protein product [Strongylus vulgaris]|uniref:Rapamycin-insensitive companion of mTOR domain-containing protein n=1 Tax=Strongylus vulgaris TaxID=40348 RepID=A0A3P7IG59_STRVU|nr:unnamed protein product [Strongylus vulgaris]
MCENWHAGFALLPVATVPQVVRLAEESSILTIRGYAFWALNLLSTSLPGKCFRAAALAQLGWESNRHRDALGEMRKRGENFDSVSQSPLPFPANPQIIVRSPRSRSSSELQPLTFSRRRASSSGLSKSSESIRIPGSLPKLRRTKSSTGVSVHSESKRISQRESEDLQPRHERAVTGDSVFTSGLGSLSEESTDGGCFLPTIVGRRPTITLDSMVGEWESRPRSSTIAYCLNQGLVATKTNLVVQGTVC